ncbi:MAG: beta strand repeat-containing protein, partial [Sphingomonas sp.]
MVDSSNGEFTYTNNGDGATSDSFVMTDASDQPFTVNVTIAAPTSSIVVSPNALSAMQAGASFSQSLSATGGSGPYAFTLDSGSPPPGISLSGNTISGTPTQRGSYSFAVKATDNTGATQVKSYSGTVANPTLTLAPASSQGSVGTPFSVTYAPGGGVTPYHDPALEAGATLPPGLTLSGFTLSGTPTATGTYSFRIVYYDSSTGPGTYFQFVPVTVTIVAAPPSIGSLTPVVGPVTGGTSVTIAGTGFTGATAVTFGGTPAASFSVGSDTSISATAPAHAAGAVDVTVTTATSGTVTKSNAFTYLPPAPVANAVSVTVAYGSTNNPITLNITGGAATSVAVGTQATHGTATASGTSITYTPTTGYYGADSFTYTATNPSGTSAPASVTVTVANPPAPTAGDKSGVAVAYGTATSIDLASAITGVHSSIAVASGPAHGTTSVSGDVVTYTPAAGYYGADSFTYTATGPGGTSAAATVNLTVGTPAAPVAAAKSGVAVGYGTATSIDLASSITGVHSSIAVANGPAHGTTSVAGDVVTYTPAAGYYGADSFTYTATGPGGTSAAATVSLTVGMPAAPVAAAKSGIAVGYGTATSIDLASSIAGVHTSITVASGPAHGTTSVAGDVVTYTPAAGYYGADNFTYTATGPGGTSSAATVSLTVSTPSAPVAADKSGVAVGYGAVTSIDLLGSITGVHTSIAVASGPAHGTTSVAGDVVTYTPAAGYYGADSFTYTATGPGGTSSAATVSLTVGAPPAPTVVGKSGVAVTYQTATPIDLSNSITGVHTSIAITTAPTHGSVSISGDVVTYTPAVSYYGPDTFAYAATGPGGTSAAASVQLTVGVPPAPVTADKNGVSVAYGMATPIDLASSITGVHSSIAVASGPAHGTTSVAGDVVTYRPAAGYYGADSFTYAATGPGGTSSAATVSLTVGTPPAPTTTNKSVTAAYDAPTAIDLSVAVTGAHTSIAVASGPARGTTSVSGDVVTYTPAAGYYGADSFTYTATGPGGTSAAATVTLAVASPPPPIAEPTSTTISGSTTGNGSAAEIDLSGKVSGVFTSVEVTTQPQHGTVTISTSAGQGGAAPIVTARYTAEVGFQGIDTFQFAAIGPGGRSAPATVTIKVVGSAPVAQNKTAATGDGQTVAIDLTDGATAGPFTAAAIVSVSPSDAANAKLVEGGSADARSYRLDVTTAAHFGGQVVV